MKKGLNQLSVIIFWFILVVYAFFFAGIDLFPDDWMYFLFLFGPIVGLILAISGDKGTKLRKLGVIGNIFILLLTYVFPLIVRTFIWNTP